MLFNALYRYLIPNIIIEDFLTENRTLLLVKNIAIVYVNIRFSTV